MAKKISSKDIFSEEDIFKAIRKSAEETIAMMTRLRKEVTGTAEDLKKSIGGAKFDSVKSIENVVKVTQKANKLTKEAIQIDKAKSEADKKRITAIRELEKLQKDKLSTEQQSIRLAEQKARQQDRINKQQARAVKTAKDEASAYKKLEKNTRDLKNQSKELGAQMLLLEQSGRKNTSQYQKLSKQYRSVTASAKAGDKQLKKLDQTVGDNFRNVGNYTGALNKLRGGLGALGLAFGTAQLARNIGGIIVDFDQAQADLGAISGKTKDELAGLTEQAKALGATTQFSATQITEMQIELAKLGFTSQQILDSTKAVSNFSAATGADMAESAKLAGATLRGFGLEANEMERVVSVLGVATTKSALSFASLNTSMSTIAPVANAFNFSVEDTTALLGTLANAGFDASSSATATRNILLNLADSSGALATELGRPITNIDDLAEGLAELDAKGINLAQSLEITDKRSVAAFQTFLKNADTLIPLRDSITDVNGELQAMADKRLDSIQGQMTLFASAWEGFILKLGEAGGVMGVFKDIIGFLARNLSQIMSILGSLIKVWVSYKLAIIALNTVQKIQMLGMKNLIAQIVKAIPFTKAYRNEQIKLNTATKNGGVATNGYKGTISALMLTGIIVFLSNVALAWYDVASGARDATQRTLAYNKAKELGSKKATEFVSKEREELEKNIRALRKQGLSQKKFEEERDKLQLNAIKKNNDEIASLEKKRKKLLKYTQSLEFVNRLADKGAVRDATTFKKFEEQGKKAEAKISQSIKTFKLQTVQAETSKLATEGSFKRFARAGRAGVLELQTTIDGLKEAGKELNVELEELEIAQVDAFSLTPKLTDKTKKYNTEFNITNQYVSRQIELLQQLKVIEQDRIMLAQDKSIQKEYKAQLKSLEETGEFDVTNLNALIEQRVDTEKKAIDQRAEAEQKALDATYKREKQSRADALIEKNKDLVAGAEGNAEALEKIEDNYQAELTKLANEEIEREKDLETTKKLVRENAINDKLEAEKEGYEKQTGFSEEFLAKELEKETKLRKAQMKRIDDLVKASADYFIRQSQRKVDQINKEQQKAQETYDLLKGLAESGNIDAKESLAQQQKIINEANKKKLAEEKKQQRIRLAESVFNTYNQKVQSDSKNPIGETIADMTLLYQFINTLPAFYDGTEDTGTNGRGVDGKGGFHAVLHPNERVIPKSLNDKLTGLSNEELTKIAVNYQNGVAIDGASQSASALELALVVNGLKDIKDEIRNKPETSIELGEITSSLMEVVKTSKKGNSVVYNRFKIRK